MAIHSFDIEDAQVFGVEAAIVIHRFQFWIESNRANKRNYYLGRWWTANSVSALAKLFPYWSYKQIRRILEGLVNDGVLRQEFDLSGDGHNRTSWYAFADESKYLPEMQPKEAPEVSEPEPKHGSFAQTGECKTEGAHLPKRADDLNARREFHLPKRARSFAQMGECSKEVATGTATGTQHASTQARGAKRTQAAAGSGRPPLPGETEARVDALYAQLEDELFRYCRTLPTASMVHEFKANLALHLGAGRTLTAEQFRAATADAEEFCTRSGYSRPTIGPLNIAIGNVINPLPKAGKDAGKESRAAGQSGRATRVEPQGGSVVAEPGKYAGAEAAQQRLLEKYGLRGDAG